MTKVSIRPLAIGDEHWLHKAVQNPNLNHWFIGKPEPYLQKDAYQFVSEKVISPNYRMGVFVDEQGAGGVNLRQPNHHEARHLLSYWISPEHQGKGVAFAGVSEFLKLIRMRHHEFEICAVVETDNWPSIKLLSKLGFYQSGISFLEAKNRRAGESIKVFEYTLKRTD